jgi:hypothetical protein
VLGNPCYGVLGLVAFPYFLVFELLGPLLEALGLPAAVAGAAIGALSLRILVLFLVVSVLLGALLSISALALEEFSFRRHERGRDAARLLAFALLENLGYRQAMDALRIVGLVDALRRRRGWGEMRRRGIGVTPR